MELAISYPVLVIRNFFTGCKMAKELSWILPVLKEMQPRHHAPFKLMDFNYRLACFSNNKLFHILLNDQGYSCLDSSCIEGAAASYDAVNLIAFFQKQFCQIAAILAGDSGN
jgi:hypothetical protein